MAPRQGPTHTAPGVHPEGVRTETAPAPLTPDLGVGWKSGRPCKDVLVPGS